MLKRMLCLLLLFLALLSVAPSASAREDAVLFATAGEVLYDAESGLMLPDAVRWWYAEDTRTYYLFLPGATQTVRLWFENASEATLDGQPFTAGAECPAVLDAQPHVLTLGTGVYPLVVMRSDGVPSMFMTTESGSLAYIHRRKGNEEPGTLLMRDAAGATLFDGPLAQIRGRGNATFVLNKKPYQIKLEKGTDLCGMGKAKTWLLLADFRDNSLLRNKIAFDLSRAVGMPYASLSQTVDLYVNNDYLGAYLLCEKVEIGDTRIDIADLGKATEAVNDEELSTYPRYGYNSYRQSTQKGFSIPNDPEDITGGYLLELDYKMRYSDEPSGFVTAKGQAVVIKEPEAVSAQQVSYISAFFQGFENAIRASDGIDPKSGKHYSAFVDQASLVKKYLLEEVLKNRDANRSSLFFYKPADVESALAFAGPAWDYDASLGNYATRAGDKGILPEYFIVNSDMGEPFYLFPPLYAHEDFQRAVVASYYADFVPALEVLLGKREDPTGTLRSLQAYADEIRASAAMNFARWPVFNSKARIAKTGADYQENIDYLIHFIEQRMAFLAGEWKPL